MTGCRFLKLDSEIEARVRRCETCQQHVEHPPNTIPHPWEWPGKPWFRVHAEYAGPFEGKMILILVDAHSKFIDAHVVNSATTATTVQKMRQIFATHGLPVQLVTDNGSVFTSEEFSQFCKLNGVKHVCTAPYHPASNGLAEHAVQSVKQGLKKIQGSTLETHLYRFLTQYRLTPHATTGQSPAELLMGRRPRSRLDLLSPDLSETVTLKQAAMRDQNVPVVPRSFQCGDPVWAMNFAASPKWVAAVLETQTGPVSFTARLQDGRLWRRHVDHLRLRHPDEDSTPKQSELFGGSSFEQTIALPPTPQTAAPRANDPTSMPVAPSTPSKRHVPEPVIETVTPDSIPSSTPETPVLRRSAWNIKPPARLNLYLRISRD